MHPRPSTPQAAKVDAPAGPACQFFVVGSGILVGSLNHLTVTWWKKTNTMQVYADSIRSLFAL